MSKLYVDFLPVVVSASEQLKEQHHRSTNYYNSIIKQIRKDLLKYYSEEQIQEAERLASEQCLVNHG